MPIPRHILPVIVFSQFAGTSLWFAGNTIIPFIQPELGVDGNIVGDVTSAVQFGFIIGTLVFALLSVADRFSPSRVFFLSTLLGGLANVALVMLPLSYLLLLALRFATGFFLAGIYPVGMKIAADWYQKGLGKALGFLVGALVLGTAAPFLVSYLAADLPWRWVLIITSLFAISGGLLLLLTVGDGPYRKQGAGLDLQAVGDVFRVKDFRRAAFGYFGHMWELYTFWAFVPVMLRHYLSLHQEVSMSVSLWSFIIIAVGSVSCAIGGLVSQKWGSGRVAFFTLFFSGLSCFVAPVLFGSPVVLFVMFLLFWGAMVVADSPQFSSLVAENAPTHLKGTALTIVNSIGFAITIVSIQAINVVLEVLSLESALIILAVGPVFGCWSILSRVRKSFADGSIAN